MNPPTPNTSKITPDTDPVTDILASALPYEEQMEQLVDLFYAAGDRDFTDYLPHDVLPDYHRALTNRRKMAEAGAGR